MAKKETKDTKESKEIKTEEKVPAKKEKKVKTVSAKKLPGMLKKAYSQEKLEKKILSKIYIEPDRQLVEKLFSPSSDKKGRQVMAVDLNKNLPLKDVERCKAICKDIKANKGGIKLVPLLAVVVLVAAIGVTVTLFKNVIVSKTVKAEMQGIFGAKTDIQKVNVELFKADLEINGLAQANKDNPMKNLFEIEKIQADFNLTDLLKGKFHAENLVVTGVALDTDRTASGELPAKQKKTKKEKSVSENQNKLAESAKAQLTAMFENYNPEKLLENLQNELQSPSLAKTIAEEVSKKAEKYQTLPAELTESVTKFSSSVNSVISTDWSKINDAAKLKSALESINSAITEGTSLKSKVETTTAGLKSDGEAVKEYSAQLNAAIKADKSLVDSKVTEMKKLFSADGLKNVMNDAVKSVMYSVCGQYYPYVEKVMDAAVNAASDKKTSSETEKEKSKDTKKKKTEKTTKARAKGIDVYYRKDTVPKFLIENAVASGYEYGTDRLLFKGTGSQISSDQNVRGEPAKLDAMFMINGNKNLADVTIDSRSTSSAPLILADYSGAGFPINADAQVFNLSSTSKINAKMTVTGEGGFTIGGSLDMAVSSLSGMNFEPARVCSLYQKALGGIKNISVGFTVGLDDDGNPVVTIENPEKLAGQLVTPVANALTGEINSIAAEAKTNVTKILDEKTGGAASAITGFTDIQNAVNGQTKKLDSLNDQLEAKKKQITNQLTNAASNAAKDAAKTAASNLLGGIKF